MNIRKETSLPSFLGIQISNGDVIPIDVRYIDKNNIIFSLPVQNAKQSYLVSGNIGKDVDILKLKRILNPYIKIFSETEEIQLRKGQDPSESSAQPSQLMDIIPGENNVNLMNDLGLNTHLTENILQAYKKMWTTNQASDLSISNKNINPSAKFSNTQSEVTNEHSIYINTASSYTNIKRKTKYAITLLYFGYLLYKEKGHSQDIHDKALQMQRQAQIILHEIYPQSFSRIVLPGVSEHVVHDIDPDAVMMSPKQYEQFIKRRLRLADLRARGILTERTGGIIYPERSKHASNRERDEFGLFKK